MAYPSGSSAALHLSIFSFAMVALLPVLFADS
jgi:hypothetical protein